MGARLTFMQSRYVEHLHVWHYNRAPRPIPIVLVPSKQVQNDRKDDQVVMILVAPNE